MACPLCIGFIGSGSLNAFLNLNIPQQAEATAMTGFLRVRRSLHAGRRRSPTVQAEQVSPLRSQAGIQRLLHFSPNATLPQGPTDSVETGH
jgi:hypothetical protein